MRTKKIALPNLYIVFLVFAVIGYWIQYPLPHYLQVLTSCFHILVLFLFVFFLGKLCLGALAGKTPLRQPWHALSSIGLGTGLLGTVVVLTGWLIPGSLEHKCRALNIFVFIYLLFHVGSVKTIVKKIKIPRLGTGQGFVFPIVILISGFLVAVIFSISPITYYDSLVYHLGLPSYYLATGKISAVPFNLYSYFPALTEMIYLFILANFAYPEISINLFLVILSMLTCIGIYDWTRTIVNQKMALWSAAVWWSAPCVVLLSVGGYVEIPQAFFLLLSLKITDFSLKSHSKNLFFISGLLAGLGCAIKYTGVIVPAILFMFFLYQRVKKRLGLSHIFLFLAGVLIPFMPWLLKNFNSIGNPVFPFFYQHLGGPAVWAKESAEGYFQLLTEYGAKSNVFFELLFSPFKILMSATEFGGGFDVLGDFGWALILLTAPFAIYYSKKSPACCGLYVYVVVHFGIWYLTKPVLRFLVPLLPLMIILGSFFVGHLANNSKKYVKNWIAFLLFPLFISNFLIMITILSEFQFLRVPLKTESRDEFLTRRLSFYPVFQILNKTSTKGKILLIGEQRTYHLKRPFISSNYFAPSQISAWCNQADSISHLEMILKSRKIDKIVVNEREIERLGGWEKFGFSEKGYQNLSNFLTKKSIQKLHHQGIRYFHITEA